MPCPVLPAEPGRCAHRARPRARSSALLRRLLDGGRGGTVAERLAAAFRFISRKQVADDDIEAMHVPPSPPAVRDAMSAFFELLRKEPEPSVRAVLGHFLFVYVHPYPDGNGRIGRFLMNVMLAAGGYPWTVIPVERRDDYMVALEDASVRGEIGPFTGFLAGLV